MKQIYISIVVCTYNRREMLRRALDSLMYQKTDGGFTYEILIVDDGSTDGTRDVVKEIASRSPVPVRYVREERMGISCARNRGIKESSGEWIAFCDDDELADVNWLKNLYDITVKKGADFVGGAVLLGLSKEHLSRVGPIWRSHLGERLFYKKPVKCNYKIIPPGGNRLVSRKVFDSVGLFDTSMLMGGCDREHFLRAHAASFNIWVTGDAVVRHVVPLYRLEHDYILWTSSRNGCNSAWTDVQRMGKTMLFMKCLAKLGQAILFFVPHIYFALISQNQAKIVDRKCLLWRTIAYTRKTLSILAPNLFPQKSFFVKLDFRKERELFAKNN